MSKQLLLTFFSVITGLAVFSQEKSTYRVTETGGVDDLTAYHEALQAKDLDAYRLVDAPRKIRFDSGVEIELFSAQHLENEYGRMRDHRFINRFGDEPVYPWLWFLGHDGRIIDKRTHSALNTE